MCTIDEIAIIFLYHIGIKLNQFLGNDREIYQTHIMGVNMTKNTLKDWPS